MFKTPVFENLPISDIKPFNYEDSFIPFAYFTLNQKGAIIEVNHYGEKILGIHKLDLLNNTLLRYVCPDSYRVFYESCQKALNTKKIEYCDIQCLQKNGHLFSAKANIKCISNIENEKKLIILLEIQQQSNKIETNLINIIKPLTLLNEYVNNSIQILSDKNVDIQFIVNHLTACLNKISCICDYINEYTNNN